MSDVSRRALLGTGVLAGTAAVGVLLGETLPAEAALGADIPSLTYIGVDAQAFWPDVAADRIYQDATGTSSAAQGRVWAPLHIPAGSLIRQISFSYAGQPIVEISERSLAVGGAPTPRFQQTVPASGGVATITYDLTNTILVKSGNTYTASAYLLPGASIIGVQVGYSPPTLGFQASTRANPRIFDTGTGGPLVAGVPRHIQTGGKGMARAVVNISAKQAAGPGFISAYRSAAASILPAVPFASGIISENLVIVPLTPGGVFTVLANGHDTGAAIDLVGFLR